MDPQFQALLTWAAGLLPLFLAAYYFVRRMAQLEFKTDTLWDFIMRRALADGLQRQVLNRNSPVTPTPEFRRWYAGMAADLRAWYRKSGTKLNERDLFVAIEAYFGERLQNEICLPNGISSGACVTAAMIIAQEPDDPLPQPDVAAEAVPQAPEQPESKQQQGETNPPFGS